MVKVGIRKPNIMSSIKARTVGKAKRRIKKALIPGYGKKGMGWLKNPGKAAYNAVYHRTTVGVGDMARAVTKSGAKKVTAAPRRAARGRGAGGIAKALLALLGLGMISSAASRGGAVGVALALVLVAAAMFAWAKRKRADVSIGTASEAEPECTPELPNVMDGARGEELVLEGDAERTVYTYDGAPLKGTRKGSVFYADVITEPVKLASSVTGSEWDTASDGGVALAVNGRLFGTTNALSRAFHEMADAGYSTKVKAKRIGMYCEGIPEIVLLIPEPEEVFLWRDACRGLGREVPFDQRHSDECEAAAEAERVRVRVERAIGAELPIGATGEVFFFDDEEWPGSKPKNGTAKVNMSTEWIPTPEGSSAKPHIMVRESGNDVIKLTARKRQYAEISKHVGEAPYMATCQRYERDDGTFCWKVAVAYLPSKE